MCGGGFETRAAQGLNATAYREDLNRTAWHCPPSVLKSTVTHLPKYGAAACRLPLSTRITSLWLSDPKRVTDSRSTRSSLPANSSARKADTDLRPQESLGFLNNDLASFPPSNTNTDAKLPRQKRTNLDGVQACLRNEVGSCRLSRLRSA